MTTSTITLQVDEDLAQAYSNASTDDKAKLDFLLNLWLRDLSARGKTMSELMDEISDKAVARGLTASKLEKMLNAR